MEEGNSMQPSESRRHTLAIDQQTREQETNFMIRINKLVQHPHEGEKKGSTNLNSMINVPTKLATLTLANAIDSHSTTLAVVRLKRTSVSMNFQNPGTVGTSPTNP